MERKKVSYAGFIVGEVLFALILIGFGVATAFVDEDMRMLCYIMMAVGGICLICVVITHVSAAMNEKKRIANVNNPSSIAHALFAEDSEFDYYFAVPNRAGQNAKNAAVSALGIMSFLFLGVGVVSYGKKTVDVFVSEDELVINEKNNPTFSDAKIKRIPASAVQNVQFVTKGKYERVQITFVNSAEALVLDVLASKCGAQQVRDSFSRLLHREPVGNAFGEFSPAN